MEYEREYLEFLFSNSGSNSMILVGLLMNIEQWTLEESLVWMISISIEQKTKTTGSSFTLDVQDLEFGICFNEIEPSCEEEIGFSFELWENNSKKSVKLYEHKVKLQDNCRCSVKESEEILLDVWMWDIYKEIEKFIHEIILLPEVINLV